MSKAFFLGSYVGGIVLCAVSIGTGLHLLASLETSGAPLVTLGVIPGLYAAFIFCVFVYRMWQAIQDGNPRTTPGKAVGFLFIPFFNLYWIFQALWGYAKDFNAYVAERRIPARRMPEKMARDICILSLCSVIPYLGTLIAVLNFFLLIAFMWKVCDGVNAVLAHRATAARPA